MLQNAQCFLVIVFLFLCNKITPPASVGGGGWGGWQPLQLGGSGPKSVYPRASAGETDLFTNRVIVIPAPNFGHKRGAQRNIRKYILKAKRPKNPLRWVYPVYPEKQNISNTVETPGYLFPITSPHHLFTQQETSS